MPLEEYHGYEKAVECKPSLNVRESGTRKYMTRTTKRVKHDSREPLVRLK